MFSSKKPDSAIGLVMSSDRVSLAISLKSEVFWELVRLGAELQTPVEDYVENVLIACVEDSSRED